MMKKNMKKWMMALVCLLGLQTTACADNDHPISVDQLPATAQQIIKKHFAEQKVVLAKMENGLIEKSYDVLFTNGTKIEFDRNGNWTEISCKEQAVPAALVPAAIATYVKKNYPGTSVHKIEKDRRSLEVELSNGLEITFDTRFQVTDIDQ